MRIRWVSLFAVLLLGIAQAAAGTSYYLALGDSLAIGIQPSKTGDVPTNQGYADDLYAVLRTRVRGLSLAKLGCSGETTTSMISGGICTYSGGSQLAAAVSFLQSHPVALITLDIGANDVDHCVTASGIDQNCFVEGVETVAANLPRIVAALRNAAGPNTPIIAMNYYDPFLAAWIQGSAGQTLAEESLTATNAFNGVIENAYQAFDVPVADVASAFNVNNFTLVPFINIPVNVFITLTWTWMAAPAPYGPDIHPDAIGYAAIAVAFVEKIGR